MSDYSDTHVDIQINFRDTRAISQDISEPDTLVLTLNAPQIFIDAETGLPMSTEPIVYEIPIGEQMTKDEFLDLTVQAEKAAQVSLVITFIEVLIIFVFKKVLFSMWVLILILQFFVYIAVWQVRYPKLLTFIFYELKKIALGEFMDDIDFGGTVLQTFGIDYSKSSATEEKVGEDRLGSSDPLAFFGPTMLIGTALFIILILTVVLTRCIARRASVSYKCKNRLRWLKKKIFFNPIARYFTLNAMKLSMSGLVAIKAMKNNVDQGIVLPSLLLFLVAVMPLIFFRAVHKNRGNLEDPKVKGSFGSVYRGKNVKDLNHKAYLYPMLLFWRRILFATATVYFFAYPLMQMYVHYFLTFSTVILLMINKRAFDSQAQRLVEVGSELLLYVCSIMLCQFMNREYTEE